MKMLIVFVILVVWSLCGYINYGLTLGRFTHRYPAGDHQNFAIFMAVAGPFALPAALMSDGPRHWRTKPLTVEERWKAFHEENPPLSRDYFERTYN